MIGIIDYGMGNLHSVTKAVERLGRDCFLSESPEELAKADKLILPGVGAFRDGMEELNSRKLVAFIQQWIQDGKPLLGICLGMQLLFDESEENGSTQGLGILPGKVKKFPGGDYKVPHMGWNDLRFKQSGHPILNGLDGGHVYFVHSYFVKPDRAEILIASTEYGGELVTAVAGRKNVWGTQFHPEKSSTVGMTMLKNFIDHQGGES
ncbi:imidazole glycerol phosphate synthase subunit HisH [Salisediminibacterium beveridgei]|uniref:Imidazole glycerol phosphate synthase subunit HisH n=1 Tax=Salisediminibacterium beveridgei TaxID=632773 RepID=A0A1D7QSH4_9BACI|nr:imidazole glycerol phosphate synthase subunit HisH [Salisediminibacterium beveridgei]AOM81966.1 Imidazole glycerol phosphate synthase amidotransferase subunit [Salisediminibacterium beveridgei]